MFNCIYLTIDYGVLGFWGFGVLGTRPSLASPEALKTARSRRTARAHARRDAPLALPRRAPHPDEQAGRRLLLGRRPGEEAFNAALGLLVHKGQGPAFDYLHLHYRSTGTLLAMGADPIDALRQMKNTATDPYSAGRNFVDHYSVRNWNVVPVSSPSRCSSRWPRHGDRATARRRPRDHNRARRRRRHGRGRLRHLPPLVLPARPELPCLMIIANNRGASRRPPPSSTPRNTSPIEPRRSESRAPSSTATTPEVALP